MRPFPFAAALALLATWLLPADRVGAATTRHPNVLVIITDDQGHGDLGFHGNPILQTPNLDQLARQSARCRYFYVSPVCAPTRASLMTGRYNYRTGVVDTYLGRALMHPAEVTLAEIFSAAGYRTAIFGKWHLGDNAPMRPVDQGFQESLVHKGGGIGQPSDPPGGESYFDPVLQHNGQPVKTKGYCSDVFTDAAIQFIRANRRKPFFVWLAYNAPHTPLQVPQTYYAKYKNAAFADSVATSTGHSLPAEIDRDPTAKVYGMIHNIDGNVGRLLSTLDSSKLAEQTLVIFLTDNGPQQVRYNSGLLERKGSVHEGGIRVPFFIRWPGQLAPGREVDTIAAHIDLAPTLIEACRIPKPPGVAFDGLSLWPLLRGQSIDWPDRTLFLQWHRGDVPQLYRAFAARSQRYKLVQPLGVNPDWSGQPVFKLFDMQEDPFERHDFSQELPEIVERLRQSYEAWFRDVSATRGYEPPRIHLGSERENPVILTRQDWRGPKAGWRSDSLGFWEVRVVRAAFYQVTLRFPKLTQPGRARFKLDGLATERDVQMGVDQVQFNGLRLPVGDGRIEAWLQHGSQAVGVHYVEVRRVR